MLQLHKGSNHTEGFGPLIDSNYLKFLNWDTANETFPDSDKGRLQAKINAVLIDKMKVWQSGSMLATPFSLAVHAFLF